MYSRRSIKLPIILGVVMIVLIVALIVGWVLLALMPAFENDGYAPLYWTLLLVGTTFLVIVLGGVIVYLALSIKAINLNRRQSNFIDSVTHELKSPIASLKLYLQTLNRRDISREEQQRFYEIMLDDVERLDHLINHVLDAGSLEKATGEQIIEDVKLAEILEQCVKTTCPRYHVPLEAVTLDLEPCTLRASSVDIEMIVRNLIDNAIKYAGSPPQVTVRLHLQREGQATLAVLQVEDNGLGIPAKQRRKIFGRFVRLGVELERKTSGTGLGLYIVRTLVRRLRGRIEVRDREGGSGTVFEVVLPNARPIPGQKNSESNLKRAEVA